MAARRRTLRVWVQVSASARVRSNTIQARHRVWPRVVASADSFSLSDTRPRAYSSCSSGSRRLLCGSRTGDALVGIDGRWVVPFWDGPGHNSRPFSAQTSAPAPVPTGDNKGSGGGEAAPMPPTGLITKIRHVLSREATIAKPGYNRFMTVPGAFMVQLSIGSVYAWSIFNTPLTKQLGVVAAAADDWSLGSVVPIFSLCAVSLGICTATLGAWAERNGPRKVAAVAATCWSSGLLVTALGCYLQQLPLLYLGYSVLGGAGWGLGYISPVSTLMKWFPDRRGLATGMALTAFGGGAMLAIPVNEALMNMYRRAPEYVGKLADLELVTEHGKRFARVAGELREVVVANTADLATWPGLEEGAYLVGTGSTGTALTFMTLSAGYLTAMLTGAFIQRVPADDWKPDGWTPPAAGSDAMVTSGNVDHVTVLKTPQFYLLWTAVCGNAVAGVSIISCAKTIMNDTFSAALPAVVTGTFAAGYVAALSAANMTGRLGWSSFSDILGRKNTYYLFGLGVPIALSIPYIASSVTTGGSTTPLWLFYGGTVAVVSFYGGLFSVLPAYLADLFGSRHVGAIHGRMLTAWSAAALIGPTLLSQLRAVSYNDALATLAAKVDAREFEAAFGAPKKQLQELVDANTVTISKLMEVVPAGTIDPTPTLYNTTMYAMAGVLSVALLSNAAVRPVAKKYFMTGVPESQDQPTQAATKPSRG